MSERIRLRFVAPLRPKTPPGSLTGDVAFLPMEAIGDDGTYDHESVRPATDVANSGYTYFEQGDVVRARVTPCFENGKGALLSTLIDGRGLGTTELFVFKPSRDIDARFLYYVTASQEFTEQGTATLYGAHGVRRVDDQFARDYRVWAPPVPTQRAIADYLDRETARLDALIAAKLRMVALSEERRAATIARSVTPALSATTRWHRLRLRHVVVRMIDTEHKTAPFYDDGEFLVIRTNNVSRGRLVVGPSSRFTDAAGYQEWTQRGRPEPGDILFTREAPAGEACLVPDGLKGCVGQRTVLFKVDKNHIAPRYLLWALYGGIARSFIEELSQGTTLPHLNMSDIADIPLWVPDPKTQKAVADQLDETTKTIDEVVAVIEQQLVLLNERRQALITAAVTGQLDIGGAA